MRRFQIRSAMTLVELLVVLAILAVLLALTIPAIMRVREVANRAKCANHLHQMGIALIQYSDARGAFPNGCSYSGPLEPTPHMTWLTRLLPYIEQDALWQEALNAFRTAPFFERPAHRPVLGRVIETYTCPSDPRTLTPLKIYSYAIVEGERKDLIEIGLTGYLGVVGVNQSARNGVLFLNSKVRLAQVTDGTSQTIIVGERPPSSDRAFGWWYAGWGQNKDGSGDSVMGVRETCFTT